MSLHGQPAFDEFLITRNSLSIFDEALDNGGIGRGSACRRGRLGFDMQAGAGTLDVREVAGESRVIFKMVSPIS